MSSDCFNCKFHLACFHHGTVSSNWRLFDVSHILQIKACWGLLFQLFELWRHWVLCLEERGTVLWSRINFTSLASSLLTPLYHRVPIAKRVAFLMWMHSGAGLCWWAWSTRWRFYRDQDRFHLVVWVLFAVVCVRIAKIMLILTVQFIETVCAFVALFKTSCAWYVFELLLLCTLSCFIFLFCIQGLLKSNYVFDAHL